MFAKIVVDVRSSNVDIMYTYKIPDKFIDYIFIEIGRASCRERV